MPCRIETPLTMFHLPNPLRVAALLLALPLLLSTGCTSAEVATPNPRCNDSVVACLDGKAVVSIETDKGRFTVEVDGNAAPLTSGNFVDLVQRGAYDGTVFHRVIPGFVAQGGDPASALADTPKEQYGTGNFIDPATGQSRLIPLEISLKGEDMPRYGQPVAEPGISDRVKLPHARGAVAMARSQSPDSASAQFYVALEPQPALDGNYAVFGAVTSGMEVVDQLENGDRLIGAKLVGVN